MRTTPRVILILKEASSAARLRKTLAQKQVITIADKEFKLSDFDNQKNEIIEELKNVKYNDLEDLVYRIRLSYDEIMDILDLKYIPTKEQDIV